MKLEKAGRIKPPGLLFFMALAAAWILVHDRPLHAQGYLHGVFLGTSEGPVELVAWAEPNRNGQLRMAKLTSEDVPVVSDITRILCNLPNWKPRGILIASEKIFRDERAERRELVFAVRRLNISALELRVEDLERKDRLANIIRAVGANEEAPAFGFVVMTDGGLGRFYAFRIKI